MRQRNSLFQHLTQLAGRKVLKLQHDPRGSGDISGTAATHAMISKSSPNNLTQLIF